MAICHKLGFYNNMRMGSKNRNSIKAMNPNINNQSLCGNHNIVQSNNAQSHSRSHNQNYMKRSNNSNNMQNSSNELAGDIDKEQNPFGILSGNCSDIKSYFYVCFSFH